MDRRTFVKRAAGAAVAQAAIATMAGAQSPTAGLVSSTKGVSVAKPNIILYLSDQFRWDFLGANGLNPSTHTPNLDAVAARGKNFTHAIANQPVCGPSRAVLMTSRYATEAGAWNNDIGMDYSLPTLAGELHKAGYSTNLIGKWHLAPAKPPSGVLAGFVKPEYRGGFTDLWEGDNLLEFASHPYYGTIYNGAGDEITYKDEYRVDFLDGRVEKFLRQKHEKPFFLFVSQLEPHQQNDLHRMVAPHGAAERFRNSYVPPDLRDTPGDWQEQLPDYYGCVEAIDASVGRLRRVLEEENLADNTVFLFMSDHGCHFMTRNSEYKRSTHNASIRVPLLIDGPGFEGAQTIDEIVGIIDYAPTILDIAGAKPGPGMRGKSILPLIHDQKARDEWPKEHLIQISGSMTGRALRTKDWTYCVADMSSDNKTMPHSLHYREYQMYDQRADPSEQVNLAGRKEYAEQAKLLRDQLKHLIVNSGDPEPEIEANRLYP